MMMPTSGREDFKGSRWGDFLKMRREMAVDAGDWIW